MQEIGSGFGHPTGSRPARPPRLAISTPPIENGFAPRTPRDRPATPPVSTPRRIAANLASATAAFLAAFILTSIFASDANRVRVLTDNVPELDTAITFAGFGLEQVTVKGQRLALVADIFDALELGRSRTFASFDAAAARARIEALPWVAAADLRRVYPNQLDVTIRERKAFAIWQDGATTALIDTKGKVLSRIDAASIPADLPRFVGPGAGEAAAGLWTELDHHPALKSLLRSSERIGGRRWTLVLTNDTRIELPASATSSALRQLHDWPGFPAIRASGRAIIDLRSTGRIAVRPVAPIGPTSAAPASISDLLEPAG